MTAIVHDMINQRQQYEMTLYAQQMKVYEAQSMDLLEERKRREIKAAAEREALIGRSDDADAEQEQNDEEKATILTTEMTAMEVDDEAEADDEGDDE